MSFHCSNLRLPRFQTLAPRLNLLLTMKLPQLNVAWKLVYTLPKQRYVPSCRRLGHKTGSHILAKTQQKCISITIYFLYHNFNYHARNSSSLIVEVNFEVCYSSLVVSFMSFLQHTSRTCHVLFPSKQDMPIDSPPKR